MPSGPMVAMYSPAVRAHRASLEQMLLLAFSRRMCCSRAYVLSLQARRPWSSVVSPTMRPGSLRMSLSVAAI